LSLAADEVQVVDAVHDDLLRRARSGVLTTREA
jgi:hypothetical protein